MHSQRGPNPTEPSPHGMEACRRWVGGAPTARTSSRDGDDARTVGLNPWAMTLRPPSRSDARYRFRLGAPWGVKSAMDSLECESKFVTGARRPSAGLGREGRRLGKIFDPVHADPPARFPHGPLITRKHAPSPNSKSKWEFSTQGRKHKHPGLVALSRRAEGPHGDQRPSHRWTGSRGGAGQHTADIEGGNQGPAASLAEQPLGSNAQSAAGNAWALWSSPRLPFSQD
jgi:hypothetical protein